MSSISDRMKKTIDKNKEAHSMARKPLRPDQETKTAPKSTRKGTGKEKDVRDDQYIPKSIEEYSPRSQVAKIYRAGELPFNHGLLFKAIKQELGGEMEGEIILGNALETSGITRRSAINMLKHMANWGVLVSEPRFRCTWVKISPEWFNKE